MPWTFPTGSCVTSELILLHIKTSEEYFLKKECAANLWEKSWQPSSIPRNNPAHSVILWPYFQVFFSTGFFKSHCQYSATTESNSFQIYYTTYTHDQRAVFMCTAKESPQTEIQHIVGRRSSVERWLSAVKTDPYKASCKTCWKEMVAELSELKKSMWFQRNISKTWTLWRKHDPSHKQSHTVILWIRWSKQKSNGCFHCWAQFAIPDHPSDLVSNAFPNFKIALEFSSKQTKTCCIVKYVIAKRFCDDQEELLRHTKF